MKNFLRLTVLGFAFAAVALLIELISAYNTTGEVQLNHESMTTFGLFLLHAFPLTLSNAYFFKFINDSRMWTKGYQYKFGVSIVGSIAISISTLFLIRLILVVFVQDSNWNDFISNENPVFYLLFLGVTLFISLLFHTFYYYKNVKDTQVKIQKVIAGTASAKFDALKNQLDPHFLFNSLNVLTSLIDENPGNAKDFTTSLSLVYRYVLEQKNKDLVSVEEELRFAKTYVTLLKMRFEDSIIFEAPETVRNSASMIVPLSLQLLLENAVKHNVVSSTRPLTIKIYEKDGSLIVENNLQRKQILKKSSGVGLGNIIERFDLLSVRKVKINQSEDCFQVMLPMLTKKVNAMEKNKSPKLNSDYLRARKRVEELKEFYSGLVAYCIVIPFLIFIWWWRTPDTFQWFWFPLLGWGIGLLFHAYKVFVNDGMIGGSWEKRKIHQFMNEEKEMSKKSRS